MVVSMFAPFVAGTSVTARAATSDATDESLSRTESIDRAPVDRSLQEANGTVEVVVRAEEFEVPGAATASRAEVIDELQAHAEQSQQPIVDYAADTDGVSVLKQFWLANAVLLEVDTEQVDVEELASRDGVTGVHENFEVNVPEPVNETSNADASTDASGDASTADADTTYGLDQVNATEVWDEYDTKGGGAKVAVLDTGVDADHPDIDLYTENASDPTYPGGWAEFDDEGEQVEGSEPHDTDSHGTHTSGTVSGGDASGEYVGVAPNVELMHGLVLPSGSGGFAQIIGGMEWAVQQDADVISMSLGAEGYYGQFVEPVRNAEDAGTIVIASSSNCNAGCSGSPGNVYDSFAIGASDGDADIASFSSGEEIDTDEAWGDDAPADWPDEYVVPDVAAPGVGVKSTVPGGGYDSLSGTSMSAPHVAGTAALLVAASGGTAGPAELQDALESTAWKPDGEPDEQDIRYGHGIVDAKAATDEVAVESGVTGTVTDGETGAAVDGVTVEADDGFRSPTDASGEYFLRLASGNYTVTADAFGYASETAAVTVPDDGTIERNFSLTPEFEAEVADGQPDQILGGDSLSAELRVAHADELTVEQVGDFDESDATLLVEGTEYDFGESISLDGHYGTLTVEVETADGSGGDLELRHVLAGANGSAELATGPTTVYAEGDQIGVVATPDDGHADAFADAITEQSVVYQTTVITPEEALANAEEYDALVAHSFGSDVEDLDRARKLVDVTTEHQVGLVVVDQQGSGADAITRLSEARGYPEVVDYPSAFLYGVPDWYADIENADHELWDGVQYDNITTAPPDFERTDISPELTTVHWGGFDGETQAVAGQVFLPSAPSVGTDDPRGVTLFGSVGYTDTIGPGDYTDNTLTALDNAIGRSITAEQTPVFLTSEPGDRVDPGEAIEATFDVDQVTAVRTEVTDESTIAADDLSLRHGSAASEFGEWHSFDSPRTDDALEVSVETPTDAAGIVELEHTFRVRQDDGTRENVTVMTRRTSVYEPPLEVPADADSIDEAIEMAVPNEEIVLADGTYEEQVTVPYDRALYNVTIRGEEGATPTIAAPDDLGANDATVEIQAMHTTIENLRVEGHQTEENRFYGIVSGVTAGDIDTHNTTIRDVTVDGVDIGIQFGGLLGGSDSRDGHVDDVTVTDTHIGIIAGTPPDETFITDASGTLVENSYVEDADMGIVADSRQTNDAVVRNNTVVDVERGISQDGANRFEVVDNEIRNASVGIYNHRGQISRYDGNVITDAEVGVDLVGDRFGGYRLNEITRNEFETDTGVRMNGFSWLSGLPIPVWVHYNDFEETDVAIESTRDRSTRANVDARLNWFGEDGEATVHHDPSASEVVHDPYLVERPENVDTDDPRAFGTGLDLEGGEATTVGLPGPVAGNVSDVLGEDFDGVVYGFDADEESWETLTGENSLRSLQGLYVKPTEDTQATLSFYHGEDAEPASNETEIREGWNFVAAPELNGAEDAYGNETADIALKPGHFERPDSGLTHERGDLRGAYVFGTNDTGPQVSPFEATFVYAEDDGTLSSNLPRNPSLARLYSGLNVDSRVEDPILDADAEPADADAAVLEGERARQQVRATAIRAVVDYELRSEHELDEVAAVAENAAYRTAAATDLSDDEVDRIVRDVLERVVGGNLTEAADDRDYDPITFDGMAEYTVEPDGSDDSASSAGSTTDAIGVKSSATSTANATENADAANATADAEYEVAFVDGMNPLWRASDRMVEELHDQADLNESFNVTPVHASEFFGDLNASLDEYDVVVVNNLGTVRDDVDDAKIERFVEYAERPDLGVVYLGQKDDDPPNAVHEISDLRGDPAEVDDARDGSADRIYYEIAEDHALFDGFGDQENVDLLVDPWNARYSWFDGYDGQVLASVATDDDGAVGPGVGVTDHRNEILLSSSAFNGFVIEWDYDEDAYRLLANAIEESEPFGPVLVAEDAPVHAEPGESIEADLKVSQMESVTVELADESTLSAEDLTLSVGNSTAEFGEKRAFDPPKSDAAYPITVETDGDATGKVVLNVTVESEHADEPVALTLGPTAVYEPPLTVGEDVDSVQEAVAIAPEDGRTVYVADGTYEESVTVSTTDLTIAAVEGADPTVEAADGPAFTVAADGVTLDGLGVAAAGTEGIVVEGVENATVTDVEIENATTGVEVANATTPTVENATVSDAATGVAVTDSENATVERATATGVETGVRLAGPTTRASVTGATVAGETGVSLTDLDRENATVRFNDFSATDVGVRSELDGTFDARLNYLGHGTANTAFAGEVAYEPFLTEPPERVDREEPVAIGVELLVEAGETTSIGVPGYTDRTVGDLFGDDFEGTVYDFETETQSWVAADDDRELEALEGLRVEAETDGHAVIEFRDEKPSAPGSVELDEGWNFVAAPLYADAETAFTVSGGELRMVRDKFESAEGQPGPASDFNGSYVFGSGKETPDVSAFKGYFVHVEQGEAGTIPAYVHSDVTMEDLYALLGLDASLAEGDDLEASGTETDDAEARTKPPSASAATSV